MRQGASSGGSPSSPKAVQGQARSCMAVVPPDRNIRPIGTCRKNASTPGRTPVSALAHGCSDAKKVQAEARAAARCWVVGDAAAGRLVDFSVRPLTG